VNSSKVLRPHFHLPSGFLLVSASPCLCGYFLVAALGGDLRPEGEEPHRLQPGNKERTARILALLVPGWLLL
jgi:hypothetical protein